MRARIAISVVLAIGSLAMTAADGRAALVGEWTFDSDQGSVVSDSSGNQNNGLLYGTVSRVPGEQASALDFTGAPGGVQVPDSPSLEPSAVTVAAWVENAGSPGRFRYILAKGWSGCISTSYGLYTGPAGGLQFYVGRDTGTPYVRSPNIGQSVWNGAWHLAVGTFDGSVVRLYVDGVEVGSGSAAPGPIAYGLSGSNDLFIGDYPGCAHRTFEGEIDDVRIWNTAFSPAQIAALMPQPPAPQAGVAPVDTAGSSVASNGLPIGDETSDTAILAPRIGNLSISLAQRSRGRASRTDAHTELGTIRYTDSEPADSELSLGRAAVGVRHLGRCVSTRARQSTRRSPCTHWITVGRFEHTDVTGQNTIRKFPLRSHPLVAGRYRLVIQPTLGDLKGASVTAGFVIRR